MNKHVAHILVTRPEGQHLGFAHSCQQLGLLVSHLPCLAIEPIKKLTLSPSFPLLVDTVLFTSSNAVIHAHRQRPLPWPGVNVHAIGAATAAALSSLQQPVTLQPQPPFTSESYLEQIRSIPNGRLLIIKGEGGRDFITQQLTLRGWEIELASVYRRTLPDIASSSIRSIFDSSPPDIVSIGSNETLTNFLLLTTPFHPYIFKIPLIVNSIRCHDLALSLGFRHAPLIAVPAGDTGQLSQLQGWLSSSE